MRKLRAWLLRFRGLFRKTVSESEFAEEMQVHLQLHVEDNLRSGMTPAEARRNAIMKLGGVEMTKQAYRERSTLPFIEALFQDLRFAFRQLIKNPSFTLIASLVLALGSGAAITIFAFVDASLIRPLPYEAPSQLVNLFESNRTGPRYHLSYLDYVDWRKLNHGFSSLAVYEIGDFLLTASNETTQVNGVRTSDNFLRTLGVHPFLGRDFHDGEDRTAPSSTVLLSYAAWQKRFAGKQDILGQKVILNGTPASIIGVLPKDFHFAPAGSPDFWLTIDPTSDCAKGRSCHNFYGIARLKEGIPFATAVAELKAIALELQRRYPETNRNRGASAILLTDAILGDIRPILLVLLSGSALLLFIATVNVSSLLLVRAERRKREIAIRGALGATPVRLIRQFITEGALLAATGGIFGIGFAYLAMKVFLGLIPANRIASMPYMQGVGLTSHVLLFSCTISLLIGALFALTPALKLSLGNIRGGLEEGGRGSAGTMWHHFGTHLVVIELATAMVLMVGAGLLGKSFYRLLHVDTGMEAENLAILRVWGPESSYGKNPQMVSLKRGVLTQLTALPGVKSAATSSDIPVGDGDGIISIGLFGRPSLGNNNEVNFRSVSTDYFATLQAQLLRGRTFTETDNDSHPPIAIINRAFARKFFPDENPVGKKILNTNRVPDPVEIVGVVDDIREGPLDITTRPVMYVPFDQEPNNLFYIIVRTSQDPQLLLTSMAASIHRLDPGIATSYAITMTDHIHDSPTASLHRSSAWLVGGFAVLALILGVVGLYGVIAYTVNQRTREIGVRMALGAQRSSVYRMILREAVWLTLIGIAIGIACSLTAASLLRSLLFEVSAWDVSTLLAVALILALSTLLASYIPARRAASVNPLEALRAE